MSVIGGDGSRPRVRSVRSKRRVIRNLKRTGRRLIKIGFLNADNRRRKTRNECTKLVPSGPDPTNSPLEDAERAKGGTKSREEEGERS